MPALDLLKHELTAILRDKGAAVGAIETDYSVAERSV